MQRMFHSLFYIDNSSDSKTCVTVQYFLICLILVEVLKDPFSDKVGFFVEHFNVLLVMLVVHRFVYFKHCCDHCLTLKIDIHFKRASRL